jgi:hypothetical protein
MGLEVKGKIALEQARAIGAGKGEGFSWVSARGVLLPAPPGDTSKTRE